MRAQVRLIEFLLPLVLWMGPSQGSQIGRKHRQRRPRNGLVSTATRRLRDWGTFPISFHRLRYDNHVCLRHPQSGPAHHGNPRRAPKGGPSSPGSPVHFSPPSHTRAKGLPSSHDGGCNHKPSHTRAKGRGSRNKSHPPSLFLSLHLRRYSALPLTLSIDKARPSRPEQEDRSLAT